MKPRPPDPFEYNRMRDPKLDMPNGKDLRDASAQGANMAGDVVWRIVKLVFGVILAVLILKILFS